MNCLQFFVGGKDVMQTGLVKHIYIQWNLVIKRSDITKPSYNKVICWSQLFIFLFLTLI